MRETGGRPKCDLYLTGFLGFDVGGIGPEVPEGLKNAKSVTSTKPRNVSLSRTVLYLRLSVNLVKSGGSRVSSPRSADILVLLVVFVGLAVALIQVEPPANTLFWRVAFNAGHVPLFGLCAIAVLRVGLRWPIRLANWRILAYVAAFVVTNIVGTVAEALQAVGPRDAAFSDLVRNALGSGGFLLLVFAFDREAHPKFMARSWGSQGFAVLLAVLMLAVPLVPLVTTAAAYRDRNAAFPRICDFESGSEFMFVAPYDAELEVADEPVGWGRDPTNRVGRLAFSTAQYSGLAISEPCPDWTGHDRLVFEIYSELGKGVKLNLRIHDAEHDQRFEDRFNRVLAIEPGANVVSVSLDDVRGGPKGREMDLSRIRGVAIFDVRAAATFGLYLDSFRLERD